MGSKTSKKAEGVRMVQVKLTVPEIMLKKLEEERDKSAYESVQEVIKETIRKRYFLKDFEMGGKRSYNGAKRGPKPKFDHEKMVSGENVLVWGKEAKENEKKK